MMREVLDQAEPNQRDRPGDDDASLIARAGADASAFAELVRRHTDGLFRFVAARVGPGAAEDVVAEVFVAAFDHRDRFDPTRGELRGWLFGMAAVQLRRHADAEGRWLQRVVAASRDARRTNQDDDELELRIVERADASRMAPDLAAALLTLTPAERDVLLLFALEDLTHEQIARALGIRRGAAKTRLSRGCARLRDQLGQLHEASATERGEL